MPPQSPRCERTQRGQMAVEMAVLVPVAIVVALVIYNLCLYVEACATFDRVALDAVVSQGVSPPGEQSTISAASAVESCIRAALSMRTCEVSVRASGAGAGGAVSRPSADGDSQARRNDAAGGVRTAPHFKNRPTGRFFC